MPKQVKSKNNTLAVPRPRKHGPSPTCRYCTARLPRNKPYPAQFCNEAHQHAFNA